MKRRSLMLALVALTALLLSGCCRHEWKEADCTTPKTCPLCEKTQGEALGHTPGNWEEGDVDYVKATVETHQDCLTCGVVLDEKTEQLEKLHEDGKFLLSPKEFMERMTLVAEENGLKYSFSAEGFSLAESVLCEVRKDDRQIGLITFAGSAEAFLPQNQKNKQGVIFSVYLMPMEDQEQDEMAAMAVLAADPAIGTREDAQALIEKIGQGNDGAVTSNGLRYKLTGILGTDIRISVE